MKKQLVSILFALCMVLCLVPLAAFAEGETENVQEVTDQTMLVNAMANDTVTTVKLAADISISSSLTVTRPDVTLDLNGHVLKYESENNGSVIVVEGGGQLTIEDSNTSKPSHRFNPNGKLWVLDEASGTETVTGGVITGGTGYPIQFGSGEYVYYAYYGGAVYIKSGGKLTMEGGNIVGCSAVYGGGVYVEGEFVMTGGSIIGCAADRGGGVYMRDNDAVFNMSGSAAIRCCKAVSSIASGGGVYALGAFTMSDNAAICDCECITGSGRAAGGGVYVSYHNKNTEFTMSGNAVIENCKVTASPQNGKSYGGGVFVSSRSSLTLKDQAAIRNCSAENTAGGATYGGGIFAEGTLTIAGLAKVGEGCSAAVGSGIYMKVGSDFVISQNLYANGGVIAGEVVLNNSSNHGATLKITGSDEGVTEFNGSVLNNNGIIEKGTFTGEVTNNGTITGGTFNGEVINNGTITGGTFNGTITGTPALATGSGTKSDPYQIGTAEGLKWFRDKVNNAAKTEDSKICAELTEDIDLSGEAWTPIGIGNHFYSGTPPYAGIFDGKGHTIKNLSIDSSKQYVGLFGYVYGGTIRNLTVSGSVKSIEHTGGIAGGAESSTFENCANQCAVQGGTTGGIIGFVSDSEDLTVRDCYNVGSITTTTGNNVGGIIGQCINKFVTIRNCYNAGTVTGTANVGAIIGNYSSDKIYNCYYLEGSVTRAGNGDTVSIPKTATEFADGTVLALLKAGERDNNTDPWDTTCKYLESAGMTLPVLAKQNLTVHTHVWSTYTTDTAAKTHTHSCACGVAETEACTITPATCKDGSACAVCGQQYGGPDTGKHADLQHFPAVAATTDAEGNKEYWYCGGCGKYFADAAATREITRADTVTAKLPQPTTPPTASPTAQPTTAPQAAEQPRRTAQPTVQPTAAPTVQPVSTIPATGDTSSPILWAALLLCGGAGLAVTAYKKNRHRS